MIFVTGGTGFLGAHLLLQLTGEGKKVKASFREGSDFGFVRRLFDKFAPPEQYTLIEWVDCDLLDIFSIDAALENVRQIYHCAGHVSFVPSERKDLEAMNVRATRNIVNACLVHKNIRLCHVSSIAAIGRSRLDEVIAEDRFWKNDPNNSWYAITKYNAEREVWRGIEEGIDAAIVNPGVILGYATWSKGTGKLFLKAWKGMWFYTDGISGFVDVKDVANAMILLMNSNKSGERYILVSENLPYKKLFQLMAQYLGRRKPLIRCGKTLANLAGLWGDFASHVLGLNPAITKETARTATLQCRYSSEKFIREFDYRFRPVEETIAEVSKLFIEECRR